MYICLFLKTQGLEKGEQTHNNEPNAVLIIWYESVLILLSSNSPKARFLKCPTILLKTL